MKKQYVAPEAEKVVFSYQTNVVASGYVECPATSKYNGIPPETETETPVIVEACPATSKFNG